MGAALVARGEKKEARIRWRWDRRRQHADQAASTADQTTADRDQTASDTDQSASDRDQVQADADQRASERDQAASDRDFARRPTGDAEMVRTHELSRTERVQGTLDRHAATLARSQVSSERDEQANQRDEVAQQRDRVAEERDRVAEEHDREMKRAGEDFGRDDPRAARAMAALAEDARQGRRPANAGRDGFPHAVTCQGPSGRAASIASTCSRSWSVPIWTISPAPTAARHGGDRARQRRSSAHGARIGSGARRSDCDRLKDGSTIGRPPWRWRWACSGFGRLVALKLRPITGRAIGAARSRLHHLRCRRCDRSQPLRGYPGGPRPGGGSPPVTVGLAVLEAGDTLETLVERADAALLGELAAGGSHQLSVCSRPLGARHRGVGLRPGPARQHGRQRRLARHRPRPSRVHQHPAAILNGYLLTLASLILLGGSLGDRYGCRRIFVFGTTLFNSSHRFSAPSLRTPELPVAARSLQGVRRSPSPHPAAWR